MVCALEATDFKRQALMIGTTGKQQGPTPETGTRRRQRAQVKAASPFAST